MKSDFIHLHVHSDYSLLQAPITIDALLQKTKSLEMPAVALTDLGSLSSMVPFYQKALQKGIKPILGCEVHVAPGKRTEKSGGLRASGAPLVLLAKNNEGYHNLLRIVSDASLAGFYYRPRTDHEFLSSHAQGLIALSGNRFSEIQNHLFNDRIEDALRTVKTYQAIFGEDNYYLEWIDHGGEQHKFVLPLLQELAQKAGARYVATNDVYMLEPDDLEAMMVLQGIGSGKTLEEVPQPESPLLHFCTAQEMKNRFAQHPQALENTLDIAQRCNVEIDFNEKHMPVFSLGEEQSPDTTLRKLVEEGLERRFATITFEVRERVEHELATIKKLGFSSYFLIVWDFIRYAREQNIPVGPGRGSCVGSIVSYCLEITDLDPLDHDLLFERFLTPDRISDPDIDIDFCREGREQVIEYVRKKYGEESVAQIATFGTLGAKAVVRDVGRVLNIPLDEVNRIAKAIPDSLKMTLQRGWSESMELRKMVESNGAYRHLWALSCKLEGLHRHISIHAGGVVIADAPLTNYIALTKSRDSIITQYSMEDVESCGILKMDFLGLKTLTVIDKTIKSLKEQNITVDTKKIPFDDAKTFEMLQRGETRNTFQFESAGMRDLITKMKPDRFEDLVALVALYRPGPLNSGMVDDYVQCKHGLQEMVIDHPSLESILKETYGVIVFQEQAMLIAHRMANFSLSEADLLRKAMAKKKADLMASFKEKFHQGAKKNGIPEKIYTRIFDHIEKFGEYGFNKSHSVAYALVSYWTCYLKANYPAAYMSAVMSCDAGNSDKITEEIAECKRMQLEIRPPDINVSGSSFTLDGESSIRFGLEAVKGVGLKAIEAIIKSRTEQGPFKTFYDFCCRVDSRIVNKSVIEALIKSGACDSFPGHRAQLMAAVEPTLRISSQVQHDRQKGQGNLFEEIDSQETEEQDFLPDTPAWNETQTLKFEKETVGFYLSNHPLGRHESILEQFTTTDLSKLKEQENKSLVTVGGLVTEIKPLVTKKGKNPGQKMCALTLEDLYSRIEAILFPQAYEKCHHFLKAESIVFLKGKLDLSRETPKVVVDEAIPLEEAQKNLSRSLLIRLKETGLEDPVLEKLKKIFESHPGSTPVLFEISDATGQTHRIRAGKKLEVDINKDLTSKITDLLGEDHHQLLAKA